MISYHHSFYSYKTIKKCSKNTVDRQRIITSLKLSNKHYRNTIELDACIECIYVFIDIDRIRTYIIRKLYQFSISDQLM